MAPVAVALIFSNMFGDQYGIINTWLGDRHPRHVALRHLRQPHRDRHDGELPLDRLQHPHPARRDAGDPARLLRGATVDGAGKVRQFFAITLPSLRPTLIFVIITSTIGGLQIFDEPRMYDQTGTGGANNQWLTISLWLYDLGWGQWNLGRAARAWILFLIILVIGVINLFITRNLVRDEGSRNTLTRRRCAPRARPAAVAADRAAASSPPHERISGGDAMSVLNEPSRRRRRATPRQKKRVRATSRARAPAGSSTPASPSCSSAASSPSTGRC
jgi:cellobiose transport system permease protein